MSASDGAEWRCFSCGFADEENMVTMRCSHVYCAYCLLDRFEMALSSANADMFPASCCGQEIRLKTKRRIKHRYLDLELVERYKSRKVEHDTPIRVYCHDPYCRTFIAPQNIHLTGQAHCQNRVRQFSENKSWWTYCKQVTCAKCLCKSHFGPCTRLPQTAEESLLQYKGWKHCPGCSRLYERIDGCDYME